MTQNITIKPISKIKPKCKAIPGNGGESFHEEWGNLYISAKGYVTPCCWYGTQEHLTKLWKDSNLDKKLHNMHHYSIKEIIEGPIRGMSIKQYHPRRRTLPYSLQPYPKKHLVCIDD